MNCPPRVALFPALLLLLLMLWGCAGAAVTTVPLTALPNPTALTKTVSPTGSANSPTRNTTANDSLPAELGAAFAKTRDVRNVRYEITSQVTLAQNGTPVPQPGLQAHGEESGENHHLAITSVMNATGETATFEYITLAGVTYIKGLRGLPGVDPEKWYIFPKELGNVTRDAPGVKSLLADLEGAELERGNFQSEGTETLSGQACTIWSAKNPKLAQSFIGIANSQNGTSQMQSLDKGEFRIWTCPDGYIHRIAGSISGHDPANPGTQATMQLMFHIFDHDAAITISAPEGAQEFQLPVQGKEATPTPE